MLIPSPDEWGPSMGTLQARYRRVLSFGDVLDESIRLFRQHWVNFALVSAVALIPPGRHCGIDVVERSCPPCWRRLGSCRRGPRPAPQCSLQRQFRSVDVPSMDAQGDNPYN